MYKLIKINKKTERILGEWDFCTLEEARNGRMDEVERDMLDWIDHLYDYIIEVIEND